MPSVLTSRQNTHVRALRSALSGQVAHAGIVGIESPHLLREALAADIALETVFVREDQTSVLEQVPHTVERYVLSRDVFESAAVTQASQGVAALVHRPVWHFKPTRGMVLLLLDGVQDPGNVGTLIRSAEAFGASAVLYATGTADAWNGKAQRASAGACFRMPTLPWTGELRDALATLGVPLLASVPVATGTLRLEEIPLEDGCVLTVGSEGKGVSEAVLTTADYRVSLPMRGKTESLNAAVAGSILLYEAARLRAMSAPRAAGVR